MELSLIQCKVCGGRLIQKGELWECESCGNTYETPSIEHDTQKMREMLQSVNDERAEEHIASMRQQLWSAINAKYIDSEKVFYWAKKIKEYLPDDFFASFCEVANSGSAGDVNAFIDSIDTRRHLDFVNVILNFMFKSIKTEYLLSLNNLIERAYKDFDYTKYEQATSRLAEEVKKIDAGVYELNMPRDAFILYSSKDMDKVGELVEELEGQGLKCFVAMRNLQHGRGAVQNYKHALETAIDNCKVVVFVSSGNSRNLSCDALKHELPYIKRKDCENIPSKYRNMSYDKLPVKFKKPRVNIVSIAVRAPLSPMK